MHQANQKIAQNNHNPCKTVLECKITNNIQINYRPDCHSNIFKNKIFIKETNQSFKMENSNVFENTFNNKTM